MAAPGSSPAAQNGAVPRDADGGSILEGDDEEARRKERNRAAAKRSRELARQHVTQLEQSVALLAQDSETLMMRLAHVEAENSYLRNAQQHLICQSIRANAAATKNPGGWGNDEPAALTSCQSLQRMPPLLLLFLSTAAQLWPFRDSAVPCPCPLSLPTHGYGVRPRMFLPLLLHRSVRPHRRRHRLRGRSLPTSCSQALHQARHSLVATRYMRARLRLSCHRRRHAPFSSLLGTARIMVVPQQHTHRCTFKGLLLCLQAGQAQTRWSAHTLTRR